MAKQSGLGDRLFVAGRNLSGDIGSIGRVGGGPAPLVVTGIDKSAEERIGGVRDGSIEFSAWFNPSAGQEHAALKLLPTADVLVTYLRGTGIGSPAASCVAKQVNYDPDRGDDGAFAFGVQALADGFGVEWGDQLTAGVRTDTTATNGTALDGVAASTFGFSAYLHVLSVAGTSVTVKLQESSDNGVGDAFVDVVGGGFTAVTPAGAPTWQRIAATPATLERYVRVVTTGTFTSAAFVVAFTRHATAVTY